MKVSFEGVGEQVLSFEKASGTEKGVFVKVSANNTVAACAAAEYKSVTILPAASTYGGIIIICAVRKRTECLFLKAETVRACIITAP